MNKNLKYGCLFGASIIAAAQIITIVAIVVSFFVPAEEKKRLEKERLEREANEEEVSRQQEEKELSNVISKVNVVTTRLHSANIQLPDFTVDGEYKRCKRVDLSSVLYMSLAEIRQYRVNGFMPDTIVKLPWHSDKMKKFEEINGMPRSQWDLQDVSNLCDEILGHQYIIVGYPRLLKLPRITAKDTFDSGEFAGWVVLINAVTGETLGYNWVYSLSSREVDAYGIGVSVGPSDIPLISEDMKKRIRDDFWTNFDKAASKSLNSMMIDK